MVFMLGRATPASATRAKHLADDDPYKLICDTLYAQHHNEDFAGLYPKDGQPAL